MDELTVAESQRFEELETVVEDGLKNFLVVGSALAEIQQKKLYKNVCKTFAGYVQKRFDYKPTYAYNLIKSAEITNTLSSLQDESFELPKNEAQCRALAVLVRDKEPVTGEVAEQMKTVLSDIKSEGHGQTAKKIAKKIKTMYQPEPEEPVEPSFSEKNFGAGVSFICNQMKVASPHDITDFFGREGRESQREEFIVGLEKLLEILQ